MCCLATAADDASGSPVAGPSRGNRRLTWREAWLPLLGISLLVTFLLWIAAARRLLQVRRLLRDGAEQRLIDALAQMRDAAHAPELKAAFSEHLEQTKRQVRQLEQVFRQLGKEPARETCPAMKGLISEGSEMVQAKGDPAVKDAALIAAAQRVEHYEIAGYGTARTFAQRLGHTEAAQILEEILQEEKRTDEKLTELAERFINVQAPHA